MRDARWSSKELDCRRLDGCIPPAMFVNEGAGVDVVQILPHSLTVPPIYARCEHIGKVDGVRTNRRAQIARRQIILEPLAHRLHRFLVALGRFESIRVYEMLGAHASEHVAHAKALDAHIF
eukprot:2753695-Prymnesium_polylepis.5